MARRIMATCERCGQSYMTGVQYPKRFCTRDCQWGTPEERFEKYTDRTPGHGPSGDCWLWTKTFTTHGYGQFSINNKTVKAHKYSYEKHKGPIPKGMCVCHSCDTPACVNPAHLWLGTQSQNMHDCHAKKRNRAPTGEGHPRAKLKDADVIRILTDTRTQKVIADEYGVDPSIIGLIRAGKIWKHLTRT